MPRNAADEPILLPARAHLVKDIVPGPQPSDPVDLVDVSGTLFFVAFHPDYGWEVWRSDGGAAGTEILKDVNPSSSQGCPRCPGPPFPAGLSRVGRRIFFSADDGVHGYEPWVSDGTPNGTVSVADIAPGVDSSIKSPIDPGFFVDIGVALFAARRSGSGEELWRSDGTAEGTWLVLDIHPGEDWSFLQHLTPVGTRILFSADDGSHGSEPWLSDGTNQGTCMLRDIDEEVSMGSWPDGFTPLSSTGKAYFMAYDGVDRDLWATDGSWAGTSRVKKLPAGPKILFPHTTATHFFFYVEDSVTGGELWASDGTDEGTYPLEIRGGPEGSNVTKLVALRDVAIFAADDGVHGNELWRSDGTVGGTFLVKDLVPGPNGSYPYDLIEVGNRIYFDAPGNVGAALWVTDGTAAGTQIVPGSDGTYPYRLTPSGNHLFFEAQAEGTGVELWAVRLNPLASK